MWHPNELKANDHRFVDLRFCTEVTSLSVARRDRIHWSREDANQVDREILQELCDKAVAEAKAAAIE
jgi:hypothetical protein